MSTLQQIIAREEEAKKKRESESQQPISLTRQALYGDLIEKEQEVKSDIADPFGFIEEEMGRREPTAPRMADIEKEKERRYQREVKKAGGEVATTEEGTRVMIPKPGMADDPLTVIGARALSETGRGIASLFGEEESIPQIRDESDVVNIGSEAIQLMAGATTGAIGAAKVFKYAMKGAPKAAQFFSAVIGAPVGEALVATEETGTLTGEEGDTTFDRKLQVLMEGMGFGTILGFGAKTASSIGELTAVSRLIKAVPVALMGTRAGAEKAAGETLADLIARAEGATTPEARAAALERIQANIAENFKKQTGIDFQDYMDGKVDLPEGITFRPTTGGTADSSIFEAIERGVAQREGMPEFRGRMEEQARAMEAGTEEAVVRELQPAVTAAETPGLPLMSPREAAESLGEEAGRDIGRVVAGRVEEAREELVEPLETLLQRAERDVGEQFEEGAEATFAGLDRARTNRQGANNAAQEATELVQEAYLGQRTAKADIYDEYGASIADVEVPATSFEKDLLAMVDERRIASIGDIVAGADPKYKAVLNQLAAQRARLANAIAKQQRELLAKLEGDMITAKTPPGAEKAYQLTDADKKLIQNQASEMLDLDAAMKEADFRDVKLGDVEGLLQAVNSIKNAPNVDAATQGAMNILAQGLEGIVVKTLGEGSEALAKRGEAIKYFQNFNDLYKTATGSRVVPNFRFGDKITNQQLAQAQDGVVTVLRNARSDNASLAFLNDLRGSMDDEARGAFDLAAKKFYKQDIYSRVRLDPTSQAARDNPAKAAQMMAAQFKRVLSEYTNLEKLAPDVVNDVNALIKQLDDAGNNAVAARKALDDATKQFDTLKKEVEATPEAKFATKVQDNDSVKAVRRILSDPDEQKKFESIWNTAGQTGQKGADGLTDTQRKLKATFAQGAMDLLYPAAQRGRESGELSLPQIENLMESNKVFDTVFPQGTPSREMFDTLAERAKAIAKRDVRALSGESATASITDVGTLVSEFINYVQGPLSKEGRRSKMLARVFFKLAGGPEQGRAVMIDAMLDPRVAFRLLEDAKNRVRQTGVTFDEAKAASVGNYVLARLGVNSIDEFNDEVENMTLQTQTEEAFAQ